MTTTRTELEIPEEDSPRGYYGEARSSYVKGLLARSNPAAAGRLTPRIVALMRRHHQIASCLLVQSLPLVRAEWVIECDDEAIAERVTAAYRAIAFDVHRTMSRALWAGFSPNSLTWSYRADVNLLCPTEVRDLEPRTCKAILDELGDLVGFEQIGDHEPIEGLYALWITEGRESGNHYGRPIIDAALDPWSDYAAIRAFHGRYLERFGEPVVLARAPAGKSIKNRGAIEAAVAAGEPVPAPVMEDNLDTALEIGENLRHHSVVVLPSALLPTADGKAAVQAWGLEFLEATGGHGSDFLDSLDAKNRDMARAMFVPDLLANNTSDTGSNALGQTHKSVWAESVDGRLDDYSRQITAQILEPIRRLNFGDAAPPVRLKFRPTTDAERDRLWQLVTTLAAGGRLPVDGRALAEQYGLPVLEEAEVAADAALAKPGGTATPRLPRDVPDDRQATDPTFAGRPADLDTDGTVARDDRHTAPIVLASVDPVAGLPSWKVPQAYDPPADWRRPLNSREERVGFAAIERGMNDAEAATIGRLVEILDTEHDRILRQINAILRKGSEAEILAALGTLEIKGGPGTVKAWTDLMGEVGTAAVDLLRSELADYDNVLPLDLGPKARALFKSYASTSADRALSSLLTEVRLELLNAYTSGVTRPGMAAIVGQVFDAHSASEAKPLRLTTRMLSAKSLNYSRADAIERGGVPLAGAQYSAILDRRTCELCEELDEQVIAIESTDLARFTPPVHHNCRCVWVWITRDEADFTPTWKTPAPSKVDRFGGLVLG